MGSNTKTLNDIMKEMYDINRIVQLPPGSVNMGRNRDKYDQDLFGIDMASDDGWVGFDAVSAYNPYAFDSCKHDWKEYTGLNEQFVYCTKCDKKRDEDEKK